MLICFLITCPFEMAVDCGRCLLIRFLLFPGNVSNLSGWRVNALIIADTGENPVTEGCTLPNLVSCQFAQHLLHNAHLVCAQHLQ